MRIFILCEQIRRGYGVDRVTIEMARSFQSKKHDVILIVTEFSGDQNLHEEFRILEIGSTFGFDTWSADIRSSLAASKIIDFLSDDASSVVISQGWPFISFAKYESKSWPRKVIFVDHGCEPINDQNIEIQRLLRSLRKRYLEQYDLVVPISNFIMRTQTIKDAATAPKQIIGWSGDHMHSFLKSVNKRKQVFFLGRFEYGYKNAQEFEKLIRDLRKIDPEIEGVYSAGRSVSNAEGIRYLGWLDDEAMALAIQESICAISFSKWEGFNLPILESERLLVPTFSYAAGASVETISNKEQLFYSTSEAVIKIQKLLQPPVDKPSNENRDISSIFRTWDHVAKDFIDSLDLISRVKPKQKTTLLLLDLTNAHRDNANSGVVHTSRSIAKQLSNLTVGTVLPIIWDGEQFQIPSHWGFIGDFSGPQPSDFPLYKFFEGKSLKKIALEEDFGEKYQIKFLQIEIPLGQNFYNRFDEIQIYSSEVFVYIHDLIAVHHPEFVSKEIVKEFTHYLDVCKKSDLILTSTEFNKNQILEYFENSIGVEVVGLGTSVSIKNEFLNPFLKLPIAERFVLMISTLEPRKGHRFVIESLELFNRGKSKDDQINLILVGNKYAGDQELFSFIHKESSKNTWLKYLGVVSKDKLDALVQNCELMIYGSSIEGFGLPILEALANGKKVIFPASDCYEHFDGLQGAIPFRQNDISDFLNKLEINLSENPQTNPKPEFFPVPERFTWPYVGTLILRKLGIGASQIHADDAEKEVEQDWEFWPNPRKPKFVDRSSLVSLVDHLAKILHRSFLNGFLRRLLRHLPKSFSTRLYLILSRGYRKIKAII
jgi:glycosyltransferase involved in cell wall biosynthesis